MLLCFAQALSISRSLLGAKSSAENGHINCRELRDSVTQAVSKAGGRIDYAEVRGAVFVFPNSAI
jgi:pantoate--beta-alanine ligase